jgi:predicted RNA-binding protein with PUA-like domain
MKTEPEVFSFSDLIKAPSQTACWEGVRNYQARNFMRDQFKCDDEVFVYHSRQKEPAIMGIAKVVREAYADPTALDVDSKYFDALSHKHGVSRWLMVDIQALAQMRTPVSLAMCRLQPGLSEMALLRPGQRLSIQPVTLQEWQIICKLGQPFYNAAAG